MKDFFYYMATEKLEVRWLVPTGYGSYAHWLTLPKTSEGQPLLKHVRGLASSHLRRSTQFDMHGIYPFIASCSMPVEHSCLHALYEVVHLHSRKRGRTEGQPLLTYEGLMDHGKVGSLPDFYGHIGLLTRPKTFCYLYNAKEMHIKHSPYVWDIKLNCLIPCCIEEVKDLTEWWQARPRCA